MMAARLLACAGALCLLLAASAEARAGRETQDLDPDIHLSTPELAQKYGYPVETHAVMTDDGYILNLHRIPYGKNSPAAPDRPAVLLQHGLLCSSADWVVMGPDKGFAYILADAGYDVWMGNARGNTYSKKHRDELSDAEYWNFSWHEMGVYDLPAVIDYIIEKTAQPKIFYSGHSMGTTMFFVMASKKPEYNDKIRGMFGLAPVAYLGEMNNLLFKLVAQFGDQIGWVTSMLGVNEFMPNSDLMEILGQLLCRDSAITQDLCSNVLFLIAGYDSEQLNKTTLPVILGHTPAGAATKAILHYGQSTKSSKFREYDYGTISNLLHYGSIHPPDYDLSKVTAPVALHYGENDLLGDPDDVEILRKKLPNVIGKFRIDHDKFNHLDFLWAIDAKTMLYDLVIRLMERY